MNVTDYVKLPRCFYIGPDVVKIARDLLGKYIFTNINGNVTAGKIVETEAYNGRTDKACHAFMKRTKRTEVMYDQGGQAYIYLCYGIHHLFNIVSNEQGMADAVLIRGIEPVIGVEHMFERRSIQMKQQLTSGPGKLSQALGIHTAYSGEDLVFSDRIWLAERQNKMDRAIEIESDVRIGVDYAQEDALLPWRFFIKGNRYVSVKKIPPR